MKNISGKQNIERCKLEEREKEKKRL